MSGQAEKQRHDPNWLVAIKEPTDGDDDTLAYLHANVGKLTLANWTSTDTAPLNATLHTGEANRRTHVNFQNGTQQVDVRIDNLPPVTSLRLERHPSSVGLTVNASHPLDLPFLRYRNLTDTPNDSPAAQDGEPLDVSVTAKRVRGLDDTRLGIEQELDGTQNVTMDTDGIEDLRMFALLADDADEASGPQDPQAQGTGHHVFTEIHGVPDTEATLTFTPTNATGNDD